MPDAAIIAGSTVVDGSVTADSLADNIDATGKGFDADKVDGKDADDSASNLPVLDASAFLALSQVVGNVPSLDSNGKLVLTGTDQIGTKATDLAALWDKTTKLVKTDIDSGEFNAANGIAGLDASADVPLDQIPATLTGKSADQVDGADAGVAANNVFKILSAIAQGDILYVDGTPNIARLAAGTSGKFLKTQGAAANPIWDDAGAGAQVVSGTYIGDGEVSKEIDTGLTTVQGVIITGRASTGATIKILLGHTGTQACNLIDGTASTTFFASDFSGGSFFVDDNGADQFPNINGNAYAYFAWGVA